MAEARESRHATSEALHARFRTPLLHYFRRRTGSADEAEDLTQEVFVRLMRSEQLGALESPQSYLFTIAANLLRDRARAQNRQFARGGSDAGTTAAPQMPDGDEVNPSQPSEERTPERVLLGKDMVRRVLDALDELPQRTKDIFILFRFEGISQQELARRHGISRSAVEKHVARALAHLSRRIER